jgi:hypothetical protein
VYSEKGSNWLGKLERRMRWLAIPNIAGLLVGLQFVGFVLVHSDPEWWWRLALVPEMILQGEIWRLVSFLALPVSSSPFWILFVLWFLYFIVEGIESAWGSFRTTLYVLLSVLLTICFSLAFGAPIASVADLHSTLFLAAAALSPQTEVLLFFFVPVKFLWLAWATAAFILWRLATGSWLDRLYLLLIYFNYLLFFGPYHYGQVKQYYRRWAFKRQMRS